MGFEGLNDLQAYLAEQMKAAEPAAILAAQAAGAEVMAQAMRGLNYPRRTGKMLGSFGYDQDAGKLETAFGWGKFYGRLKESGHKAGGFAKKRMPKRTYVKSQPHLKTTFAQVQPRINEAMLDALKRS